MTFDDKAYPQVIDAAELARQAHIPDAELERDLLENEIERENLEKCADAFEVLMRCHAVPQERNLFAFRALASRGFAIQRVGLSSYLRRLRDARLAAQQSTPTTENPTDA